jgi:CRP-like cAMP-binding protein
METLERILGEHPFFRELPPADLRLVVGCAANVRFASGDYVIRAGEEANAFFLLREGTVALEVTPPGRPPIVIQTIGAGEVLGWSWLVPPYHWNFDGVATGPVRAIALDGRCLRAKCDADPALGYELLKRCAVIMEQRLQATRMQLLDLYGAPR